MRSVLAQLSYGCTLEQAIDRVGVTQDMLNNYKKANAQFKWLVTTDEGKNQLRGYAAHFYREDTMYLLSSIMQKAQDIMNDEDTDIRSLMKVMTTFTSKQMKDVEGIIMDKEIHQGTMELLWAKVEESTVKLSAIQQRRQLTEGKVAPMEIADD